MKKLTARYKKILLHRGRVSSKNSHRSPRGTSVKDEKYKKVSPFEVTVWDGEDLYVAKCTHLPEKCPATLCLYDNTNETLSFLENISRRLNSRLNSRRKTTWVKRRRKGVPIIKSYFDFGTIENLSTAAALVITSVYDRAKRLCGSVPPAINLEDWGDDAFKVFYEIGFFELIGHVHGAHPSVRYHDIDDGRYRLMQIMSGQNANELEDVADGISGLLEYLGHGNASLGDLSVEINGALGEAMINVARHAYPPEYKAKTFQRSVGRWWITGRADRDSNTLTIVVYDQGATIPGTLPRRVWFKELIDYIKRTIVYADAPNVNLDHEYIAYSMRRGKTQTLEPGRGEGLPQMQELIDFCGSGWLRIFSRSGAYSYDSAGGVTKLKLPIPIEGTLVEWELKLPSVT